MFITAPDLAPFATIAEAKATAMIADAEAMAILAAPCLADLTTAPEGETPEDAATRAAKLAAVKAILRGAILRWHEAGNGATQGEQQTAGPFGVQRTFVPAARRAMFWPSELEQLQDICGSTEQGDAFVVDTAPTSGYAGLHAPWCSWHFGALYCSCGVDIAGYPLFEVVETE